METKLNNCLKKNHKAIPILACVLFIMLVGNVNSYVNDAYSFIIEQAINYKKEGFKIRYKYFKTGYIKPGERKAIVHKSLFKGNEYWFWVGFNVDKAEKGKVHIHIKNKHKQNVEIETKQYDPDGNVIGARILAPQTGLYYIVFGIDPDYSAKPENSNDPSNKQKTDDVNSKKNSSSVNQEITENSNKQKTENNENTENSESIEDEEDSEESGIPKELPEDVIIENETNLENEQIQWAITYAQR